MPTAQGVTGSVTYSITTLPAGLTFTPSTRAISGTPTTVEYVSVTYTATDSLGSISQTFNITISSSITSSIIHVADVVYGKSLAAIGSDLYFLVSNLGKYNALSKYNLLTKKVTSIGSLPDRFECSFCLCR